MYIPMIYDRPPTLYSIMDSMANYGKEEKTKIVNLAEATHEQIFNFKYPLTSKIDKKEFECNILNKFIMRRIGFDTFTAFVIQLNVKLNEIMPRYNILFEALEGWTLFDGEKTTRTLSSKQKNESTTNVTDSNTLTSNTTADDDTKNLETDYPQGDINSDFFSRTKATSGSESKSHTTNNANTTNSGSSTTGINGNSNQDLTETIERIPAEKIEMYNAFIMNRNNIYTMIYNDLEELFYGLV